MSNQFNQFKARYVFADFWLISTILVFCCSFFSQTLRESISVLASIPGSIFHTIFFCTICGAIIYRLKFCKINLEFIVGNLKIKQIPWILLLIVFLGEQTLTTGINYLEYYFTNLISPELVTSTIKTMTEVSQGANSNLLLQILQYLLLLFVLVIVAPVTEEFIFRGVLLHRWAVKWGAVWGVVLSSLLFGAIHADIFWFSRAVGSIFIALFYIQTKNLLVPIVLHALNNALAFVNILFHNLAPNTIQSPNITHQYLWYGIINVLLAIPVLIYFLPLPKSTVELPYFLNQSQINYADK